MARILVIDDEERVQDILRVALTAAGHEVNLASNGIEGISSYTAKPADVVVCDIFMDRMDGLETVQRLVRQYPSVKIITVSGGSSYFPDDYAAHAKRFGAVASLPKPIIVSSLLKLIDEVMKTSPVGERPPEP